MFVQITCGVSTDRLGRFFTASLSWSMRRQQLKCVISPFPGTPGDVAAPSFALALALKHEAEQKNDLAGNGYVFFFFAGFSEGAAVLISLVWECINGSHNTKEAAGKHSMKQRSRMQASLSVAPITVARASQRQCFQIHLIAIRLNNQ